MMTVGVLGVQGAVSEHMSALEKVLARTGADGAVRKVRRKEELARVERLVIPGGESTTISRLLQRFDLYDTIRTRALAGELAIMGTCAGCILLAEKLQENHLPKANPDLLELMEMEVDRNAFGRQRESFQRPLTVKGFDEPFDAVFIRGPIIAATWGDCETLASIEDTIVMARQERCLAVAFHPELTADTRIHELFLKL